MVLEYLASLTYYLLKYTLIIAILYVVYLVYWLIIEPYRKREYFKKYTNVRMTDKFYPMIGDVALWIENAKNGFGNFHHYIKEAAEHPDIDLRFMQTGERSILD